MPNRRDERFKIEGDPEEALQGLLGGRGSQTVYVELLGEAVDAWRPVTASKVAPGIYRLPDEAPDGERWAFAPGSVVRCERRAFADGDALAAVAAAE